MKSLTPLTPLRALAILFASGLIASALPMATASAANVQSSDIQVTGAGGVILDSTIYLPAMSPAPAILLAHGFGGDKSSVTAQARDLARAGYVVLTWTARGF